MWMVCRINLASGPKVWDHVLNRALTQGEACKCLYSNYVLSHYWVHLYSVSNRFILCYTCKDILSNTKGETHALTLWLHRWACAVAATLDCVASNCLFLLLAAHCELQQRNECRMTRRLLDQIIKNWFTLVASLTGFLNGRWFKFSVSVPGAFGYYLNRIRMLCLLIKHHLAQAKTRYDKHICRLRADSTGCEHCTTTFGKCK